MATVEPFRAVRPRPELAAAICELPYDVLSGREAREVAALRPRSFYQVSRPEVRLAADAPGVGHDAVHVLGRESLDRFLHRGWLLQDERPRYHLYRQTVGEHSQLGLVALSSCEEYDAGIVRKHERTRPDKEDDRVRHMEILDAQTGPVFLAHPSRAPLVDRLEAIARGEPVVDFTAADSVRHTAWVVSSPEDEEFIRQEFAAMPLLYIADGHHRSAAASVVARRRNGAGGSDGFVTVSFPHDRLRILAYNRFVHDLSGRGAGEFLERVRDLAGVTRAEGAVVPEREHVMGMYLEGAWHRVSFAPSAEGDPAAQLDVSWLQDRILGQLLSIGDPRTSERISFVGGIGGTGDLERLVDERGEGVAFSLFPTPMESLMTVAGRNGIMPPKSTWFEPKLRDGMFCHLLR